MYVIEDSAANQLVFLFRPSTTNFDYVLNFAFNEVRQRAGLQGWEPRAAADALPKQAMLAGVATLLCCWLATSLPQTAGPAPFGNISVAWGVSQLFEQVRAGSAAALRYMAGAVPLCTATLHGRRCAPCARPLIPRCPPPRQQVWPTMQSILDERVVDAASRPEVWVAGYSMGGGAAQVGKAASGGKAPQCPPPLPP